MMGLQDDRIKGLGRLGRLGGLGGLDDDGITGLRDYRMIGLKG